MAISCQTLVSWYIILNSVQIVALTEETEVKNQFRFQDIFNDTSVHCFTAQSLSAASEDMWLQDTEPMYDGNDLEIIETAPWLKVCSCYAFFLGLLNAQVMLNVGWYTNQ